MRKVARRIVGLVVVVGVGCSFEAGGSNDSNQLGSSAGSSATGSAGGNTETDDTTQGNGSTSFVGGSTSVGNDEACVDSCAPAVPGGWSGPFYAVDATTPVECPTGFARQDLGFRGLGAPPASCGACSCNEDAGDCRVSFALSVLSGCGSPVVSETLQDAGCNPYYNPLNANVRMSAELAGAPVSCEASLPTTVPEATWESTTTFCSIPMRGGDCGENDCVAGSPDGYATQLCISSDGDIDCPGGDWASRSVVYRSLQDDRTCEGCTCTGPSVCEGEAFAHSNDSCGGTAENVPFNSCTSIAAPATYSVGVNVDNGSCQVSPASEVAAAGQATPLDPVTVCCAP